LLRIAEAELGLSGIAVERVSMDKVESYGIADVGDASLKPFGSVNIKGMIEKPSPQNTPSNLTVLGRYILPSTVIGLLAKTKAGVGGEIQLTGALDELIKRDGLRAVETDAMIFDCGHNQGFLGANLAVGIRNLEI